MIAELDKGIYWVGGDGQNGGLHCNPYLLLDGDEGVLFDPGSVLDFDYVYDNITKIIPLEKIKYIVLHHQDPDLCSSVPLFEKKGGNFKIVTHWRTQMLVKYYGIKSDYYIVNENNFCLALNSGRRLNFIQTPYLHFPGAITTYDPISKILFSSDLFGAISNEWTLYAKEGYIEKMKVFHEHYMPSNEILRPIMEIFLKMDISIIAPQHGSIINSDVKTYIRELRDLECGLFLTPIRKELSESGGYISLCSSILQRYAAIFNKTEVLDAVKNLDIEVNDETLEIIDYNYTGDILWNLIFEQISIEKGPKWLIIAEPFVRKLSKEYDIPMPSVFESSIKKTYELSEENLKLKEINDKLEKGIKETQEKLLRCPVTGLYNYEFFKQYLTAELDKTTELFNSALIIINIDNMAKIRFSYGDREVDEVLKNTVYIIEDLKAENTILFRLQGAAFAWYLPNITKEAAVENAERVRNAVAASRKYIESITISLGVVFTNEIKDHEGFEKHLFEIIYELAMLRVRLAHNRGKNIVCSSSHVGEYRDSAGTVMVVDTDDVNIDIIKTSLENLNYEVIIASDGEKALDIAENELPDIIITEIMTPKKDAFLLRESLLSQSQTKNIPFVLISHLKNEDTVKRALSLGIEHYLKKPFMLSELLGIIKLKIKGDAYQ